MTKYSTSFKVSAALKNLIGRELITNNYVAVFELVKNAFDAGSSEINIFFDLKKSQIVITDNGSGMSFDDIVNKWLFIGYSEKKCDTEHKYSGNKGIGRFSCDRLGSELELSSVRNGEKATLSLNWDDFEEDQTEEIQEKSITVSTEKSAEANGTKLLIKNLRDKWNEREIDKAKNQLIHLISPTKYSLKQTLFVTTIFENNESKTELLKNDVFDYMEGRTIYIETILSDREIKTVLHDRGRMIFENTSKNSSLIKRASIKVFFADKNAKTIFKKKTGTDLIHYGSVYIYRNSFRVFPYGEPGFDIFDLDKRKSQGHFRYLGTREIFGWIDIEDIENHFIESTSRDKGFIENIYSESLKEVYYDFVQKPLEKYASLVLFGSMQIEDYANQGAAVLITENIANQFRLKDSIGFAIDESVDEMSSVNKINQLSTDSLSYTEKKKILRDVQNQFKSQQSLISAQNKELTKKKKENEKLRNEIEIKDSFIESNNPARQKVLEHDLGLVIDSLYEALDKLSSISFGDDRNDQILRICKEKIGWAIFRTKGIRKIALKSKINTVAKSTINVGAFFEEYKKKLVEDNIKISIHHNGIFKADLVIFDLITIFDNVVSNVKGLNGNKIDVYVYDNKLDFVTDTFSEDNPVDFSRVFNFGYSTRGGTGIGMYFVKQICLDSNMNVDIFRIPNSNLVNMEITKNA